MVDKVIAYFQRPDGAFERHEMYKIDYDAAIETRVVKIEKDGHPDYGAEKEINGSAEWSLEPPPAGAKIIDKVPRIIAPSNQPAAAPAIVERPMTANQVQRKIRSGAAGAP
jgi:hypothetical protein